MSKETYQRVVPRDFFNEAKLLKCMGMLSLLVLDRLIDNVVVSESGDPFEVEMDENGALFVSNYIVTVHGVEIHFYSAYNSKANFPFYCISNEEEYLVFNENGTISREFRELTKTDS